MDYKNVPTAYVDTGVYSKRVRPQFWVSSPFKTIGGDETRELIPQWRRWGNSESRKNEPVSAMTQACWWGCRWSNEMTFLLSISSHSCCYQQAKGGRRYGADR